MANPYQSFGGSVGGGSGASLTFKTLSAAGGAAVEADSTIDTLTLSAMGDFEVFAHPGTDTIVLSGGTSGGGGGGSAGDKISQTVSVSNSFAAGDLLFVAANGSWEKSMANTPVSADVAGMVETATGSEFTIVYEGEADITGHTHSIGAALFLSETVAGSAQLDEPSNGNISKPIGIVKDANTILIQTLRGMEVVTGVSEAFKTISTTGQSDIVADTGTDILTLSGMGGVEIQHHAATDTVIISGGDGGGGGGTISEFQVMMIAETFR